MKVSCCAGGSHKELDMDEVNYNDANPEESTEEELPHILRPEFYDIFPMFAGMLDVKSFMKLAMTCKEMYERCMEDKSIRINVKEDFFAPLGLDDGGNCSSFFRSSVVSHPHNVSYLRALTKLPCDITLLSLHLQCDGKGEYSLIQIVHKFLKKIGVNRIEGLIIWHSFAAEWESVIPLIQDFHIPRVYVHYLERSMPLPIIRSILQLNLDLFSYGEQIPAALLLDVESPIKQINIEGITNITSDEFMWILSKIQAGSLHRLVLRSHRLYWRNFRKLAFDYDGELPEERPLVFTKRDALTGQRHLWFLRWQGDVVKCTTKGALLTASKCEPNDCPGVLRKKEDVFKDLSERIPSVPCSSSHFESFFSNFKRIEVSYEGPLPTERPLCFKTSDTQFWLLGEDNNLMEWSWKKGCATWKPYDQESKQFAHPALAEYMFWKLLKELSPPLEIPCKDKRQFESWFCGVRRLDVEYSGPLDELREQPVVFPEKKELRVVLIGDALLECKYSYRKVHVNQCSVWNRPAILLKSEHIREMLQDSLQKTWTVDVKRRVDMKTFCDGFAEFKTSPIDEDDPQKLPLFFVTTTYSNDEMTKEHFYSYNGAIRKATWRDGQAIFSRGDMREMIYDFRNQLFRVFAEAKFQTDPLFLELGQFRRCLLQFKTIPFDYSGPLPRKYPLAFVKEEVETGSSRRFRVWFLWEDMRTTYGSWGEDEPEKVIFRSYPALPPVLQSKKYQKTLTKAKNEKGENWFKQLTKPLAKPIRRLLQGESKPAT